MPAPPPLVVGVVMAEEEEVREPGTLTVLEGPKLVECAREGAEGVMLVRFGVSDD